MATKPLSESLTRINFADEDEQPEEYGGGHAICPRCDATQLVTWRDYFREYRVWMDGMVWCHKCHVWSYTESSYEAHWTVAQ